MRPTTDMCPPHDPCRSGFTREYGGGCDGESPGDTGQQARPLRGLVRKKAGTGSKKSKAHR
ncbi:hypothetical protein FGL97_03410 [Pseudomonas putida]|nr:hypothetical protein [Pseudomonas putida]NVN67288.1 hypothetical protein [Pseudomonas putida]